MRFPNAFRGVRKIFVAEILSMISALCLLLFAVFMGLTMAFGDAEFVLTAGALGLTALILMVVGLLILVVAFILHLIGIINAGHDEPAFKTALVFLIITIASKILYAVFQTGFWASFCDSFSRVTQLATTIFIIQGIINLADKLNNSEISEKGKKIFKLITVMYIFVICGNIIFAIFGANAATGILGLVSVIAAGVIDLIQYILFISLLAQATKMLATA